jgi:hypothetical protein
LWCATREHIQKTSERFKWQLLLAAPSNVGTVLCHLHIIFNFAVFLIRPPTLAYCRVGGCFLWLGFYSIPDRIFIF